MPLQSGSSRAAIGGNIAEMLRKYKSTGTIGNTTPGTPAKARQIAAAAAYHKAGKSRKGKGK